MTREQIEKCGRQLGSKVPLIGPGRRRSACRRLADDRSATAVAYLVQALSSTDPVVRQLAGQGLRSLEAAAAVDALCEAVIGNPTGPAAHIVTEMDYQHTLVSRRCLVLLLTGQIERYLDLDFETQYARAEYQAADAGLKRRIAEAVRRSGDERLVPILGGVAATRVGIDKRARELTEQEAAVVLEVYAQRGRWEDIFAMLFLLPLGGVMAALDLLAASGWRPEVAERAALLDDLLQVREQIGEMPPAVAEPAVALGPVIAKWVAQGRAPELAATSADNLQRRLREAPPPEAVGALAALSARGQLAPDDIEAARTHAHWPVRLACLALCNVAPQFIFSEAPVAGDGGGMWVEQLTPHALSSAIRRPRALDLSLDRLEAVQTALSAATAPEPARAACGRVLCALGAYRLRDVIEVDEEMVIHIAEDEIEIEE